MFIAGASWRVHQFWDPLGSGGLLGAGGQLRAEILRLCYRLFLGCVFILEGFLMTFSLKTGCSLGMGDLAGQDVNICLHFIVGVLVLLSMVGALEEDSQDNKTIKTLMK